MDNSRVPPSYEGGREILSVDVFTLKSEGARNKTKC